MNLRLVPHFQISQKPILSWKSTVIYYPLLKALQARLNMSQLKYTIWGFYR
jgi:hypothetical protein